MPSKISAQTFLFLVGFQKYIIFNELLMIICVLFAILLKQFLVLQRKHPSPPLFPLQCCAEGGVEVALCSLKQ
jgi:hypothetical protein